MRNKPAADTFEGEYIKSSKSSVGSWGEYVENRLWGLGLSHKDKEIIREMVGKLLEQQRREDVEWFKKLLHEPKYKTIPCPANPDPKFSHWIGKHGIKAICYQCGQTTYCPKTKTKDDILSQLSPKTRREE